MSYFADVMGEIADDIAAIAEICRRIVADMTGIGLLNEPDPILEYACEYHD